MAAVPCACLTLRIRGPNGTATLREMYADIPRNLKLDEFRKRVAETCGVQSSPSVVIDVPESVQQFKAGFPPQALPMDLEAIDAWGLQNGDALVLQQASHLASAPAYAAPSHISNGSAQVGNTKIPGALHDGSTEGTRKAAPKLREVVRSTVASDPFTFNGGFLGRENAEYQNWIINPQNWGGAIELFILSKHYGCEISAFDIQTKRVDIYGQDQGHTQRCMVVYDGLHYDALAVAAFSDAPEEVDCTLVDVDSPDLEQIMEAAKDLVQALHEQRAFTDTSSFTLRCGICSIGLKGQSGAVEHAKQTGHQNFQEYR